MTGPYRKRRPPVRARILAAVVALAASLTLGSVAPSAEAHPAPSARWSDTPHGFASLAGGTTGGAGGDVVTVTDQAALARYAAAPQPYVIRVAGSIEVEPYGSEIVVASNKTITGAGHTGQIVHGELNLKPGTHNVIIRNLTIRDSAVEGDWDCKNTDYDGIQLDTVHHVWIDHNWFNGTKQRNPSADNCAYAHLYNNYLTAQADPGDPVWTYGNWARGRTKMVIENSYYEDVQHPYQADATAELVQRGSVVKNTTGRHDSWGEAFDPRAFYDYRLDPAAAVPALVKRFSGPQKALGAAH